MPVNFRQENTTDMSLYSHHIVFSLRMGDLLGNLRRESGKSVLLVVFGNSGHQLVRRERPGNLRGSGSVHVGALDWFQGDSGRFEGVGGGSLETWEAFGGLRRSSTVVARPTSPQDPRDRIFR